MIPYSRPKLSDLYTLSQSLKLLENHTLPSGTYLYMAHIWQSLPPWALTPNSRSFHLRPYFMTLFQSAPQRQ